MKFNLKQLFSIVGESKDFACEITADELEGIRGYVFNSPIRLRGRFYNRAGVVHLEYSAAFEILHSCDRCLKEFVRGYEFSFDHIVVPSRESDNDEYIAAEGESIELNDIAVTDSLLQLPTKILCRDDCKGLCMICGCDLNDSVCDCLNLSSSDAL